MPMTGADFVVAIAREAADRGQPFASEFLLMASQAALGSGGSSPPLLIEVAAVRPLREEEASPVSILLSAYEVARQEEDAESVDEVLRFGMALLAKWAYYLAIMERHPSLSLSGVEDD